jgi:hypothetical protein
MWMLWGNDLRCEGTAVCCMLLMSGVETPRVCLIVLIMSWLTA